MTHNLSSTGADALVERQELAGDRVDVVQLLGVGARGGADPVAERRVRDEWAEPLAERLGGRGDDGHLDAVRLLRPAHRLVVEERDDRLAEREALDREDAVPA